MWSRFSAQYPQAKAWMRGRAHRQSELIDGIFSFAVEEKSPKPRLVEAGLGGGAMYDLGVYTIEMASYFAMGGATGMGGLCRALRAGRGCAVSTEPCVIPTMCWQRCAWALPATRLA